MATISLDSSKLLGFRLLVTAADRTASFGAKVGVTKIGAKVGSTKPEPIEP